MATRSMLAVGLALAALAALCVPLVDRPVAELVERSAAPLRDLLWYGTHAIETVFLWPISKLALGLLLVVAGVALRLRGAPAGRLLLLLGLTHLVARILTGTLKNAFERLRPHDVIDGDRWADQWFTADGNSFPSTHTAHFWSLYFILAHVFPRARLPLAIIPLFISAARIGLNDHFTSDVLAGAAIAALLSWAALRLTRRPLYGSAH